jgi:hypothetical protein
MRIALIDGKKTNVNLEKRNAVNFRNFVILKNILECELLVSYSDLKKNRNTKYDVVILGFGGQSSEIDLTKEIINNSNKVFFMSGEYEQTTNRALDYTQKDFTVIRNYTGKNKISHKTRQQNDYILNINLLVAKHPNQLTVKKYDCIYYGRWREDRKEYFLKYIQGGLYLSTSTKNMKKFKHIGCNPKYLDTINWTDKKETLNLFRYSLYIEDKFTHNVFNNLANRWYEAGFCNNVMFFDINCKNTIKKSEISEHFDEYYYVSNHNELMDKINECNKDWLKHLNIQKSWRVNELKLRQEMINDLKKIIGI